MYLVCRLLLEKKKNKTWSAGCAFPRLLSVRHLLSHHPPPAPLFLPRSPPPPRSTLFPYTTLFRSSVRSSAPPSASRSPAIAARPPAVPHGSCRRAPTASPIRPRRRSEDRKSTRLNSSHRCISYAVFCLKKKRTRRGARGAPFRGSSASATFSPTTPPLHLSFSHAARPPRALPSFPTRRSSDLRCVHLRRQARRAHLRSRRDRRPFRMEAVVEPRLRAQSVRDAAVKIGRAHV